MEQKGFIKTSLSWFSSRIRRVFGREEKQEKKINNLQNLYMKFQKQQEMNLKKEQEISKINFKKKSEVLEIVLKKLRNQENLHLKYQARKKKIQQYTQMKTSQQKQNQLVCPICMEFYVNAVPTICGHTFCKKCIEQALLFKSGCPICRSILRGNQLIPCIAVNNIVKMHVYKNSDVTQKQSYDQRLLESQEWQKLRKIQIQNIQVGKRIDVRDTEFIWCIGRIDEIYKIGGQIKQILIHYLGWNKIYDEIIEIKSPRLAPLSFYTSRNDINRYANNENDENYFSYVITGAQLLQQQQQQLHQVQIQEEPSQQPNIDQPQSELISQHNQQLVQNNNSNEDNENQIEENVLDSHQQYIFREEESENHHIQANTFNQRIMLRLLLNEIGLQNLINLSQRLNNNGIQNNEQIQIQQQINNEEINYFMREEDDQYNGIQNQNNQHNQERYLIQPKLLNKVDQSIDKEQEQQKQEKEELENQNQGLKQQIIQMDNKQIDAPQSQQRKYQQKQ